MKSFTFFRVAAVSKNTNSFGLKQMVMIARNGMAYKACFNYLNVKEKGEDIIGHTTSNDSGEVIRCEFTGGELVERIDDAPEEVVTAVYQ